MNKGTKATLLAIKPTLKPFELNGNTYYIRSFTVGDVNREVFEYQNWLKAQAMAQGIELNLNDEDVLAKQLEPIADKYRLARNLAIKLCDEKGNNLFDPDNIEDLEAILTLDDSVLTAFNQAENADTPKNSPPDASSN